MFTNQLRRSAKLLVIAFFMVSLLGAITFGVNRMNVIGQQYRMSFVTTVQIRHLARQIGSQAELLAAATQPGIIQRNIIKMREFADAMRTRHQSLLLGNPGLLTTTGVEGDIREVYVYSDIKVYRKVDEYIAASDKFAIDIQLSDQSGSQLLRSMDNSSLVAGLTQTMHAFQDAADERFYRQVMGIIGMIAAFAFVMGAVLVYIPHPAETIPDEESLYVSSRSILSILNDFSVLAEPPSDTGAMQVAQVTDTSHDVAL